MADEPVDGSADARRVARLDGLDGDRDDGGNADGGAGQGAGTTAGTTADLRRIGGADPEPAAPVADLFAVDAPGGSGAGVAALDLGTGPAADSGSDEAIRGPVALFDAEGLGADRADVPVAELGTGASTRRPARGGVLREGRGRDGEAGPVRQRRTGDSVRTAGRRSAARAPAAAAPEGTAPVEGVSAGPGAPGPAEAAPEAVADPGGRTGGRRGHGPKQIDPDADPVEAAREICLRLLTERARTRQELAQALQRRGVPDDAAHTVLERFDEVGLIDDSAFAGQWVRSRHNHRGLARRAIAVELRRKGVSDEDAVEALAEVDAESEERRARELVDRKLRSIPVGSPEQRAAAGRRLVGMLARKGYGAGTAYRVVKEALAERGAEADELGGADAAEVDDD